MARYRTRRAAPRSRGSYGRGRSYRSARVSGRSRGPARRSLSPRVGRGSTQRVVIQVVGANPAQAVAPYAVAAAKPTRRQF